jgi:CMP-N,N'-diacetyllegionaminic acid synthase
MTKVTAVIVARGGSKRVLRKNVLMVAGKTLVAHKIGQLQQCPAITNIIVGSDDDQILAEASKHGAEAVKRPEFYCDEERASANDMIGNMCSLIRTDIVVWAHCTNPLVSGKTYGAAIDAYFRESAKGHDSLISVAELREHLWGKDGKPLNYNPYAKRHVIAAELEPIYKQDGAIFIQPYEQMAANHYYFGQKPYLYVMPDNEVLDINTMHDFALAKAFLEAQ